MKQALLQTPFPQWSWFLDSFPESNRLRPIDEDHKIMISVSASQSWPLERCDAILNLFRFHVRCVLNRLMKGKREKTFLAKKKNEE